MNVCSAEEILAADTISDVLEMIVHGHAEMITGRRILAGQRHIAKIQRDRLDQPGGAVVPMRAPS